MQSIGSALQRQPVPRIGETVTESSAACPLCKGAGWTVLRPTNAEGQVDINLPGWGTLMKCVCNHWLEERTAKMDHRLGFTGWLLEANWSCVRSIESQDRIRALAKAYINTPVGWIYLHGAPGTGKTFWAALIVNLLRSRGHDSVIFANTTALLRYLRAAIDPATGDDYDKTIELLHACNVLVLDDLGAERGTAWAMEQLYELCNFRYVKALPTIITSNHAPHKYPEARLASRFGDVRLVKAIDLGDGDIRAREFAEGERC
jgi:hypothetical protein